MSETMDMLKEIVILNGDEIGMGEPPCVLWKADHDNCVGCPYELGCGKQVHLGLAMMSRLAHTPTSFDDFQKMENRIQELQDRVLKAKTLKELKAIPHI